MQINHLKKEMLIYELVIRGITVDDSKTVEQLRATLRPVLKLEKQGKPLSIVQYPCDLDSEFVFIETVKNEISNGIKSMNADNAVARFERNQSRLVHLLGRTDRIPISSLSPDQVALRNNLLLEILSLLDDLENFSMSDPNISVLLSNTQSANQASSPTQVSTPTHSNPPVNLTSSASAFATTQKYESIQKWGVKFTGDAKFMSVHAFLERVNELMIARHVSESDLFNSAIDLFSGKALNWFRAYRSRFSNWKELSDLLIQHFQPPDYKSRLFRELLDRTQDTSEGIVDYLSSMSSLFRRYGSVPPDAQLEIIIRNLSPFYTTQLPVVDTIEELEAECLKLEAKKYRAEHYVPPPRRRVNLVEPDFAFVDTNANVEQTSGVSAVKQNNSVVPTSTEQRSQIRVTCWNCHKVGHLNRDCTQPRKLHCFKCGQVGTTIRNCPNCSSGNGSRGNQN